MNKIDWKKIADGIENLGSTAAAVYMFVLTVYPEATPASIIAAFKSGAWVEKGLGLLAAWALLRYKNPPKVKISYVTDK